jgi:potassium-transporting ATPase KdpC subunit
MKENILPALKLTLASIVFFSGMYTALIWGVAQFSPNQGKGFITKENNSLYYKNMGQAFYSDKYFWSRPSAVSYNASGSCGSNKGPSNTDYLALVQERIDTFLVHNPGIEKSDIPVDLITASGSGLDPHISPQGALVQVKRIAKKRNLSEKVLISLIQESIQKPLWGVFGTSSVNVLELNMKLEKL